MGVPVGMIAAAIAVPLVLASLRKLFPAVEREPGDESLDALKAVHQRTELIGILVFFFVFGPLCGYAWWLVFVELACPTVPSAALPRGCEGSPTSN